MPPKVKKEETVTLSEVKEAIQRAGEPIRELIQEQKQQIESLTRPKTDWESKINPEYIVLNRQKKDEIEKVYKKNFYEIDIIKDNVDKKKYCLVLLQGMRDLLDQRGYESVDYSINHCSPDFVSATCHITFTPEYPDQPLKNRKYSFGADAHRGNTASWYGEYLTAAAFNRAMCLCLRNALKINTVCYEEIGADINKFELSNKEDRIESSNPASPIGALQRKMNDRNISFEKLQQSCIKKNFDNAAAWTNINDIPIDLVAKIIQLINEKESKEKEIKD